MEFYCVFLDVRIEFAVAFLLCTRRRPLPSVKRLQTTQTVVILFFQLLSQLHGMPAQRNQIFNFYVSLTVHLSITLANDQLDAQILNTFITILYMYMFRAGGQMVLTS